NAVFSLFDRFRPNPPLAKQFASRAEMDAEKEDRKLAIAQLSARIDRGEVRFSELRAEWAAGFKAECQRIYDKIDASNAQIQTVAISFNNAIQDLERAIGVLEGKTSKGRA